MQPEVHPAHVDEALGEEARRHEERHRQRDLRGGERRAEPRRRSAARRLTALSLQRRHEIRTRAVQRRKQSEEQAGADRERAGEERDRAIDLQTYRVGGLRRQHRRYQIQRPARDEDAADAAKDGEQARFPEQLTDQLAAARADRQPDGHLAGARGAAREQQVRDVRAGDHEHERRDAEEERERRLRLARDARLPVRARLERDRLALEARERLVAHPLLQRRFDVGDDLAVRRRHRRARLLDRHARLQPCEEVRPVGAPVVEPLERLREAAHRDRREDDRPHAERRSVEAARRDADDRHRLPVHCQPLIEDVRVAAEPPEPVRVAQHDHVRLARRLVVVGAEQPAERRLQREHVEIGAGDEQPFRVLRLVARGQIRAERYVRGDAGERRLDALEVPEHRVAEDLIAVARLAARLAAGLRPRRAEVHEPLRRRHVERLQQQLVEQ